MSERYSGMCVGGPKDRQFAKCDSPFITFALPLPRAPFPVFDEPFPVDATVDRVTYRHVAFHFGNSNRPGWQETRGFWTPEEVEDQHLYVVDELAKAYRERSDG